MRLGDMSREYMQYHWDRARRDRCPDCRLLTYNLCTAHWYEYDETQFPACFTPDEAMFDLIERDAEFREQIAVPYIAQAERILRGEA